MLRSRSYNAAVRSKSLEGSLRGEAGYYFRSNKFISINESQDGQESKATGTLVNDLWAGELATVAVKDNIATSGLPTTCASSVLKSHTSPFEATVVGILRNLGISVKGKTNLDEFGMGSHSINSYFGPVSDGSRPQRSVGGSSGGSAIAVAKKLSHFALGTDTGGSVRLPAAYTGVVGFKPSYGLISRSGVVPYANSLDTVGLLSPSTKTLSLLLSNLRTHDPRDPTSVTNTAWKRILLKQRSTKPAFSRKGSGSALESVTIGVPVEYNIEELDPAIRQAWQNTLCLLRTLGFKVAPVSLPNTKHAISAYYVLAPAEAASNLSKYDGARYGSREATADGVGDVLYSETRGKGFGDEVKRRILLGSYTLSASAINNYFLKAQRVRRLVQRDFDRVFATANPLRPEEQFDISDLHESISLEDKLGPAQVDFIVCPTAPTLPPTLGEAFSQSGVSSYMNDVFTVPASLAGLPAINIPCEIPKEFQKPDVSNVTGIQIIGQYGSDFQVLQIANQLEQALSQQDEVIASKKAHEAKKRSEKKKRQRATYKNVKASDDSNPTNQPEILRDPFGTNLIKKSIISVDVQQKYDQSGLDGTTTRIYKHASKKGDYYRGTLTEKEAGQIFSNAFDGWPIERDGK